MPMPIEIAPTSQMVPAYFYLYSGIACTLVSLIALMISLFSFRIYRKSSIKPNLVLSLGFLGLSIAFVSLAITNLYTYFYTSYDYNALLKINTSCYNIYYISSLISYLLFAMMYLPGKIKNKFFVFIPYLPLWYIDNFNFHLLSILIIGYVLLMNLIRTFKKKSLNSFLVTFAFFAIEVFHISLLLIPFDVSMYLAAYSLLAVGFSSLLIMLIRVSVK